MKQKEILVRENARIRPDQKKYVNDLVKKNKGQKSQGEIVREIYDYYISKHK